MNRWMLASFLLLVSAMFVAAQAPLLGDNGSSNITNVSGSVFSSTSVIESPWGNDSKICIFIREWILKGVFIIIFLVFLMGVATISGAAFPEWRNYGSKMIIGSIGSVVLYIIGSSALKFFMGFSICGL